MATVSHLGVLRSRAAKGSFQLTRHAPSADLAPWVERHWIVRWDLEGREPYPQETLPHPCVNLVIDAGRTGVFGVGTRKFEVLLEGRGQVVGAKFKPGAFQTARVPEAGTTAALAATGLRLHLARCLRWRCRWQRA